MKNKGCSGENLRRVLAIIDTLRSPEGCLWDRSRKKEDIGPYLIDEAYEVLDALEKGNAQELQEELGDLLFQILFIARICEEEGSFTIDKVIDTVTDKMIRRHPHVFGDTEVQTVADINANWEKIKEEERREKGTVDSIFGTIPRSLPALMLASKITKKAAKVGFDWEDIQGVLRKIEEESAELKTALDSRSQTAVEAEIGDLFLSLVNLSRFLDVKPEQALRSSVNKFIKRFSFIEKSLEEQGKSIFHATLDEMDHLWNIAKKYEEE